jgi:Mg2+ and Co2+ transporter CorA
VGRSVTTEEIAELVQSAKLHTFSNLQELEAIEEEVEKEEGSSSSSSTSLQHLRAVRASRIEIDRLLSSLRPEINRLASLRQSMHKSASQGSGFSESACSSPSAFSLHNQRSQELSEAMYDVHEMEDDIAMRYGDTTSDRASAQSPQKKVQFVFLQIQSCHVS